MLVLATKFGDGLLGDDQNCHNPLSKSQLGLSWGWNSLLGWRAYLITATVNNLFLMRAFYGGAWSTIYINFIIWDRNYEFHWNLFMGQTKVKSKNPLHSIHDVALFTCVIPQTLYCNPAVLHALVPYWQQVFHCTRLCSCHGLTLEFHFYINSPILNLFLLDEFDTESSPFNEIFLNALHLSI